MDFANFPSRAHFFSFSLFFSLCGQSLTCAKLTRHRFNYQPVFVYVAIRNIVLFVETNNPFTFYLFKGTIFDPIALLIIGQIRRLIGSRPQLRRTSFTHSRARPLPRLRSIHVARSDRKATKETSLYRGFVTACLRNRDARGSKLEIRE